MNPNDPPQTRALHRAADRHVPALRAVIEDTLTRARANVTAEKVQRLLEAGVVQGVLSLVDFTPIRKAIDPEALAPKPYEVTRLENVLIDILRDGALAAAPFGPGPENAARLALGFDIANPYAVRWARQNAARLVTLIDDEGRNTIRAVLANALRYGGHPRETAREIADVVGMTERQAIAVVNYRRALTEKLGTGRSAAGLRSRFTLGTVRGRVASEAQVDRLVSRYAQRQIRARALNLARTETISASQNGAFELQAAMANRGYFDRQQAVRVWSTAHDDRACRACLAMDGKTISFDQQFAGPSEIGGSLGRQYAGVTVNTPPLHPSCRCSAVLRVPMPAAQPERPRVVGPPEVQTREPGSFLAEPTDRKGKPLGANSRVRNGVKEFQEAVAKVHGAPVDLVPSDVPVVQITSSSNLGGYVASFKGDARRIELSSSGGEQGLNLAHEVGHMLDHRDLGTKPGTWTSYGTASPGETVDQMAEWRDAVKNSEAYKELRRLRGSMESVDVPLPDGRIAKYRPDHKYLDYLMNSNELFARSYAQWVAVESHSPALLDDLAAWRDKANAPSIYYPMQWEDADFEPIRQALSNLFRKLGLAQ